MLDLRVAVQFSAMMIFVRDKLSSREQHVQCFGKLCTNGFVPDCFLVMGLDNNVSEIENCFQSS